MVTKLRHYRKLHTKAEQNTRQGCRGKYSKGRDLKPGDTHALQSILKHKMTKHWFPQNISQFEQLPMQPHAQDLSKAQLKLCVFTGAVTRPGQEPKARHKPFPLHLSYST